MREGANRTKRAFLAAAVVLGLLVALVPAAPAAAATVGPFPDGAWFAYAAHTELLGRGPDPAWAARAGAAAPRAVYAELLAGDEYAAFVAPVVRLYKAAFARYPDPQGLAGWVRARRAGHSIHAVAEGFAGSAEFRGRYGAADDAAFVDAVYANVLGRGPDPAGRAAWLDAMARGLSRGGVLVGFSESAEHRATSAAWVDVVAVYVSMLRRGPDGAGLAAWIDVRNRTGSGADVAVGVLGSAEYRNRWPGPFAPAPLPRPRVAVFGDSLVYEAEEHVRALLGGSVELRYVATGGVAPCDQLDQVASVVQSFRPNVVLFGYYGNSLTPCMAGAPVGSQAHADRYRQDIATAAATARSGGAHVHLVTFPSSRQRPVAGSVVEQAMLAAAAAAPARVTVVDGGRYGAPGGAYHDDLPCMGGEPCLGLPSAGRNPVRGPDGVHFCPTTAPAPDGSRCGRWSSGAWRYGLAFVEAVRARHPG